MACDRCHITTFPPRSRPHTPGAFVWLDEGSKDLLHSSARQRSSTPRTGITSTSLRPLLGRGS